MTTTYKMKRELRDAWIADLTSGNFAQATGVLYRSDDPEEGGYCCLGVLVCSAKRLGLPIELNEANTDALAWGYTTFDGGDYMPIQEHLFVNAVQQGTSGFFLPFVQRNDGFRGNEERGEPAVERESFTVIAEFIRENVEAV